jgi:hypothetical protein
MGKDGLNNQLYIVQAQRKPFTAKQTSKFGINSGKSTLLTKELHLWIRLNVESPNSEQSTRIVLYCVPEIIVTDLTN